MIIMFSKKYLLCVLKFNTLETSRRMLQDLTHLDVPNKDVSVEAVTYSQAMRSKPQATH